MTQKFKKIFRNFRVIILLICLVLAVVSIQPNPWNKGLAIKNIITNSSAAATDIERPKPMTPPMSREIILSINNLNVETIEDFSRVTSGLKPNKTIQIRTNKGAYKLTPREKIDVIVLNETTNRTITEFVERVDSLTNKTYNETITKTIIVPKTKEISRGIEDIGIRVVDAPTTNIRKGLDLQGGTRVLLKPETKISQADMDRVISNIEQRLNVYGLSDISVRQSGDLSGNQYIIVEIAGTTEEEVKELLSKQGKFEAVVGNTSVFRGGADVKYVCRSPECSGIDPLNPCGLNGNQWICRFRFSITLSPESAQRQAQATGLLSIITENKQSYLSEKLILFLDNQKVDELSIGSELKGKAETNIQISGSGLGATQQDAINNAFTNMKRLQTILETGSLPVKLEITKTDTISNTIGEDFLNNSLYIGLLVIASIILIMFLKYRTVAITGPIFLTIVSELIIVLGVASLIGWNIDVAAIAGILISLGTGVNHQIVITDETLHGERKSIFNWKERIKNAFFIIMVAYFTMCVAMLPLLFAGAGLLKGFAITTIIGVSVGVFITRPAYAAIIEILLKE